MGSLGLGIRDFYFLGLLVRREILRIFYGLGIDFLVVFCFWGLGFSGYGILVIIEINVVWDVR